MIQASMVDAKNRGGQRIPWRDDPAMIRDYLRIYREVRQDRTPVTTIARDFSYSRTHIYWIVGQVDRAMHDGSFPVSPKGD